MSDPNPDAPQSPPPAPTAPPTAPPVAPPAPGAGAAYPPPAYGSQSSYGAAPAYGSPPAYGAPAYTPYPSTPKANVLAIVSLIASIAGFVFLPFIGSVAGVITGHISLRQLRTSGEGGRGMAIAGTVVGWVGVALSVIVGVIFVIWFIAIFSAVGSSSYYDYS